jgi:hypothetical protein
MHCMPKFFPVQFVGWLNYRYQESGSGLDMAGAIQRIFGLEAAWKLRVSS